MKTIVLYHGGGCRDGFAAAWIAKGRLPVDTEFIPVNYGEPPPDVSGAEVFVLDFSYKRPVMRDLILRAHHVTVLDHHKTAQAELAGLADLQWASPPTVHFDMTKSGARLAWEHFHDHNEAIPGVVGYVEDRDLWQWKRPNSRAVNACLRSYPLDFAVWDEFGHLTQHDLHTRFIEGGRAILRAEQQIVDSHVKYAREIDLDGHRVLSVNATVLQSEIAGTLAVGRPFGVCFFIRSDGKRIVSLRSEESGLDVSEIAKAHGGGGHAHAAGYEEDM